MILNQLNLYIMSEKMIYENVFLWKKNFIMLYILGGMMISWGLKL